MRKGFILTRFCDILTYVYLGEQKGGRIMILLKVIFCILLCCPLAYGIALLFMKMVDDAVKKH